MLRNGPDRHSQSLRKRGQRQPTSRFEQAHRVATRTIAVIRDPRARELALRGIHLGLPQRLPSRGRRHPLAGSLGEQVDLGLRERPVCRRAVGSGPGR